LNKKTTPYIYILFFSLFASKLYSQENNLYYLNIKSKDSLENNVVKKINYSRKFSKLNKLNKTKDSVLTILKEKGYYSLLTENINQQKKSYTFYLKLGVRINTTHVKVNSEDKKIFQALNLKIDTDYLILENEKLKPFLNSISNYLIENGQLFSKVRLINSKIKNQSLFTELQINRSKKRTINRIIINGYPDFPSAFTKHYLNLNNNKVLNENRIEEISKKINRLRFASEIKKPEILFSKDSTLLYIYIKKKKSNSFDGLINFSTENNKINFRGYLDLNLVNIFNSGEEIKINWRNSSNNKQDFTLETKIPYLFNSKISSDVSFSLFRNDSTYINTNSRISLSYPISKLTNISLLLTNESSRSNIATNNISSFDKKMIGIGINYNSQKNNQFNVDFSVSHGKRISNQENNQYLLNLNASSLLKTSDRTVLYIRNKSGLLFSDSYLENELFREGGANSIRGFNEQSISTSKYSYINSELRFLSKNKSYLYSVHDIGAFNLNAQNSILYSIGFGYNYIKNNNSINISYIYGNSTEVISFLSSSILSIKLLTLF
jgi:hypothetical protein